MRVHCFQHVPFEGLGSIASWLSAANYEISHTLFFKSASLPHPNQIDLLVIMGGPMSINDEDAFPWLVPEKQFIREMIASGKPVLGICLGAQLIAGALGADVYPNGAKEIGWFPIQGIPSGGRSTFRFPSSMKVFHWHGETFDLPSGAIRLARSKGCENQAFQIGSSVIGLQFHLETTPASARDLVRNCRNELIPSRYVQSENEILSVDPKTYRSIHQMMAKVLDYLQENNGLA